MKYAIILSFLAASVAANGYGHQSAPISISYGSQAAPSYAAAAPVSSYSAPASHSYGSSSSYGSSAQQIPITSYNQEIRSGGADFSFSTGNGIHQQESTVVQPGGGSSYDNGYGQMVKSDSTVTKTGSFSYTSPDGTPISLTYTADANGFRASGAHLPTPPPIPAEILKSLHQGGYASSSSSYGGSSGGYSAPVRSSGY